MEKLKSLLDLISEYPFIFCVLLIVLGCLIEDCQQTYCIAMQGNWKDDTCMFVRNQ